MVNPGQKLQWLPPPGIAIQHQYQSSDTAHYCLKVQGGKIIDLVRSGGGICDGILIVHTDLIKKEYVSCELTNLCNDNKPVLDLGCKGVAAQPHYADMLADAYRLISLRENQHVRHRYAGEINQWRCPNAPPPPPSMALRCEERPIQGLQFPKVDAQPQRIQSAVVPLTKIAETRFATDQVAILNTRALDAFAARYKEGPIVVEGYCDVRGDTNYNYQLGIRRAAAVRDCLATQLRGQGKSFPEIIIVSRGEDHPKGASLAADRKAVVTAEGLFKRAVSVISANTYLIDASFSMAGFWSEAQAYVFPKKSAVYSFNSYQGVVEGFLSPDGGTPLWDKAYDVISKMAAGQQLLLVTDGGNNSPCVSLSDVIQLATQRKVRVSTAYIGSGQDPLENLVQLAHDTGGAFYIRGLQGASPTPQ